VITSFFYILYDKIYKNMSIPKREQGREGWKRLGRGREKAELV